MRLTKLVSKLTRNGLILWANKHDKIVRRIDPSVHDLLERVQNNDGEIEKDPTEYQMNKGKHVGNPIILTCLALFGQKTTTD